MVREIITLNIGGCGIQLGPAIYKRYCQAYNIHPDGSIEQKNDTNTTINKFFEETSSGVYFGRNIFCDLDPSPFNQISVQPEYYNITTNGNNTIFGKEDGANIFSRGYNYDKIDLFLDRLRMNIDCCDNFQGFMVNHSITGAAGSGLTAQILETIGVEYRKKCKIGFEVCPIPSGNRDCNVLDPYNTAISMHKLLDNTDVSVMFDNKSLYNKVRNNLNIYEPQYKHLNEIISKCITKMTYPLRVDQYSRFQELNEYQSYYVPFPRLHFLSPSMSPIKPKYHPLTLIDGYIRESYTKSYKIYGDIRKLLYNSYCINQYKSNNYTLQSVTESVFNANNFLMDYPDFNVAEDLYMSCFIHYTSSCDNKQGINGAEARNTCLEIRRRREKMAYIDWIPYSLECMVHELKHDKNQNGNDIERNDVMLNEEINSVMLGNNTYFIKWCNNRIIKPFNLLFDKRAFVHWFYNEKFEEGDFVETTDDLFFFTTGF